MTTLQKTIALTIAATIITFSIGSDVEAGRRGHSARRGGSSTHRGMSRSRNNTRTNSSRRMQSSGKQQTPMNSTHNRNRFGNTNKSKNLNTGIKHNGFNSNWNRGQNRNHNNKYQGHIGTSGAYRHYRRNFFVPPTSGFGFNYSYQQATYSNPYCSPAITGGSAPLYDDSVQLAGEADLVTETTTGEESFGKAREAFYKGNLKAALPLIEQASKEMPGNPNVQQFRSLVLFAMKDYDKSAAAAYTALTIGPGWNWDTLQSLFPSAEIYTSLLRALEEDMGKDQTVTSKKFLLAYHYLMLDHKDAARKQLITVVKAEARNDVAKQLLKMIGGTPQAKETATPPVPVE